MHLFQKKNARKIPHRPHFVAMSTAEVAVRKMKDMDHRLGIFRKKSYLKFSVGVFKFQIFKKLNEGLIRHPVSKWNAIYIYFQFKIQAQIPPYSLN